MSLLIRFCLLTDVEGGTFGRCPSSAKRKRLADWPGADECRVVAYATSDGTGRGERSRAQANPLVGDLDPTSLPGPRPRDDGRRQASAALGPHRMTRVRDIGCAGFLQGGRIMDDTPSQSLLIPVANTPSYAGRAWKTAQGRSLQAPDEGRGSGDSWKPPSAKEPAKRRENL